MKRKAETAEQLREFFQRPYHVAANEFERYIHHLPSKIFEEASSLFIHTNSRKLTPPYPKERTEVEKQINILLTALCVRMHDDITINPINFQTHARQTTQGHFIWILLKPRCEGEAPSEPPVMRYFACLQQSGLRNSRRARGSAVPDFRNLSLTPTRSYVTHST